MTHTPGPWRVDADSDPLWLCVRAHTDEEQQRLITTLAYNDDKANARLIAAAPDILAALQEIVSWGEQATGCTPDAGNARECARIARAAIAKATGAKT